LFSAICAEVNYQSIVCGSDVVKTVTSETKTLSKL